MEILSSSVGWRLGLQSVTGVLIGTFFLGTFYRSASLYHPQRRAILHLKTQKKKIKSNKEKMAAAAAAGGSLAASAGGGAGPGGPEDGTPPFFEFNTLKSRTVQIMLFSTALAFGGINAPLILLVGKVTSNLRIANSSKYVYFHFQPQLAQSEGIESAALLNLQLYLGIAWVVGCVAFGSVIVNNSTECRIARQYLCQAALFICALAIYALSAIRCVKN